MPAPAGRAVIKAAKASRGARTFAVRLRASAAGRAARGHPVRGRRRSGQFRETGELAISRGGFGRALGVGGQAPLSDIAGGVVTRATTLAGTARANTICASTACGGLPVESVG